MAWGKWVWGCGGVGVDGSWSVRQADWWGRAAFSKGAAPSCLLAIAAEFAIGLRGISNAEDFRKDQINNRINPGSLSGGRCNRGVGGGESVTDPKG